MITYDVSAYAIICEPTRGHCCCAGAGELVPLEGRVGLDERLRSI